MKNYFSLPRISSIFFIKKSIFLSMSTSQSSTVGGISADEIHTSSGGEGEGSGGIRCAKGVYPIKSIGESRGGKSQTARSMFSCLSKKLSSLIECSSRNNSSAFKLRPLALAYCSRYDFISSGIRNPKGAIFLLMLSSVPRMVTQCSQKLLDRIATPCNYYTV